MQRESFGTSAIGLVIKSVIGIRHYMYQNTRCSQSMLGLYGSNEVFDSDLDVRMRPGPYLCSTGQGDPVARYSDGHLPIPRNEIDVEYWQDEYG